MAFQKKYFWREQFVFGQFNWEVLFIIWYADCVQPLISKCFWVLNYDRSQVSRYILQLGLVKTETNILNIRYERLFSLK